MDGFNSGKKGMAIITTAAVRLFSNSSRQHLAHWIFVIFFKPSLQFNAAFPRSDDRFDVELEVTILLREETCVNVRMTPRKSRLILKDDAPPNHQVCPLDARKIKRRGVILHPPAERRDKLRNRHDHPFNLPVGVVHRGDLGVKLPARTGLLHAVDGRGAGVVEVESVLLPVGEGDLEGDGVVGRYV